MSSSNRSRAQGQRPAHSAAAGNDGGHNASASSPSGGARSNRHASSSAAGAKRGKNSNAGTAAGGAPPSSGASSMSYSAFSKMHLSALFQRRQGKQGDSAKDARLHKGEHDFNGTTAVSDGSMSPSSSSYSSPPPGFASSPSGQGWRFNQLGGPTSNGGSEHGARQHASGARSSSPAAGQQQPYQAPPLSGRRKRNDSSGSTKSVSRVRRMSSSLASLFSQRGANESDEPQLDHLLTDQFPIPEHVEIFKEALRDDAGQQEVQTTGVGKGDKGTMPSMDILDAGDGDASAQRGDMQPKKGETGKSNSADGTPLERHTMTQISHPRKVGRIAAASDFAPVYERTQAKRTKLDAAGREGMLYILCRFPLLVSIFLVIALEFAAYVLIRQLVNVTEYLIAWRGHKGTLRSRMRRCTTAEDWRDVALELDSYLGFEQWKCEDASGMYDWILIKKVLHSLKTMRQADDAEGVMSVLELCLRNNFAGIENFRLYSETFFGTKYLIESYLSEVEEAIAYVAASDKLAPEARRSFYRGVQKNMGRSALCLSGGGAFGYYHVGVVRALLDANLLPSIITGTSAGGLIAALACTRTNDELKRLLVPELADRITACEEPFSVWGPRAWRTGARFDVLKWAQKSAYFTMGSMTFAEAYARTGKVLNISVIPSDRHSPVKLLNYHTAPNCIIWSSLLASAAVPGLLNPVCLMQKTRSGHVVPWNWGHRFKDGSLRVDIPLQDLHSLFNVNYPIVSQVNPHVHLFFFAPKGMPGRPVAHRRGKGWRGGFLLSAGEHVLKLNLSMNFKIIRDLDLLPSLLGQDWSSVFLQRFGGAVTIWPKTRALDWVRILSDPDRRELGRMMHVGQSVTFPKLHMIENRVRLERAIEQGRRANRRLLREMEKATAALNSAAGGTSGDGHSAADSVPFVTGGGEGGGHGPMTASDTDGGAEDFFGSANPKQGPLDVATSAKGDKRGGAAGGAHIRRLHRQLTNGFSRVGDDAGDRGGARGHDQGMSRDVSTPDALLTPGEAAGQLPRHIRERSRGLDDEYDAAEGNAAIDYAHQDDEMSTLLNKYREKQVGGNAGMARVSTVSRASSIAQHRHLHKQEEFARKLASEHGHVGHESDTSSSTEDEE